MGIDRVDNSKGYILDNVVPACGTCNRMKHAREWGDVLQHFKAIIAGEFGDSKPFNPAGCGEQISQRIARIRRRGPLRGYEVSLTNEEMTERFHSKCVYCKAVPNPLNGIDRKDNQNGYTPENSVPCCKTCNQMKGTLSVEEFVGHAEKVANYHLER